jgi:hypothetical protein
VVHAVLVAVARVAMVSLLIDLAQIDVKRSFWATG